MPSGPAPTARRPRNENTPPPLPLATVSQILRQHLAACERGEKTWSIPRLSRLYQPAAGMHYHFLPEMLFIIGGAVDVSYPEQTFHLRAGDLCILPGGMPHHERARATDTPYRSLIVNFYNQTVYAHGGYADAQGRMTSDNFHFFTTALFPDLVAYLSRACELHHDDSVANRIPIRALLTAVLALVGQLVDAPLAQPSPVRDTISRCQWLVKRHAGHESLSVRFLAARLDVSPNYLSRIFHEKTGERVREYVTQVRVQNALDGLRSTPLSVKAIAAACGFKSVSYFCRVFRAATGRTPQDYRHDHQREQLALEGRPKTILAKGEQFVGGGVSAPLAINDLNAFDALRCTRLSVEAIAKGLGFRDEASFSEFFANATGQTPAEHRRSAQAGASSQIPAAGLRG